MRPSFHQGVLTSLIMAFERKGPEGTIRPPRGWRHGGRVGLAASRHLLAPCLVGGECVQPGTGDKRLAHGIVRVVECAPDVGVISKPSRGGWREGADRF